MGKITRKSDREEDTPKPRRKRRKKDLDHIHSKILKAKRKLDNEEKDSEKNGPKRNCQKKICNRLLPRPFAGIYRNGAKGKDIRNERSENALTKARLEGDALKLLSGDTPEPKRIVENTLHDKAVMRSPNKEFVKNSLEWTPYILGQSPVLGKRQDQNQKLYITKKKGDNIENIVEYMDANKVIKPNVNRESKYIVQREDVCKRKLFQNDWEQSENDATQIQIFDNVDFSDGNKMNEKRKEQISEGGKNISWDPLSRYMELCARISTENFEMGFLKNYESDPLTTTIKKLRQAYANSYRQQLLRDKSKRELLRPESSALSVEYQACTYSDNSQLSSVEFEVPKCNENQIVATRFRERISQKADKFHPNLAQSSEPKKSRNITQYISTPCSSQDTFATYGTNISVAENRENNDKQHTKQSFYFVNEKNSVYQNSRRNLKAVDGHPSKNDRYNKKYNDGFHIDIPSYVNLRCVEKTGHLGASSLPNGPTLSVERHLSKDPREKLPTTKRVDDCELIDISDDYARNDVFRKCNDRTTNNTRNVKRIPTILRRCNNVTVKNNRPVQTNGDTEGLRRRSEINLFNGNPSNGIAKIFYETEFSNVCRNFPTAGAANVEFDRSKILVEPQIESMRIRDAQESQVENCEVNVYANDLNGEFRQFDSPALHNTNAYIERHARQQQVALNARKRLPRSNNNCPVDHSRDASFSNFNVEPARQPPARQTRSQNDPCSHVCEISGARPQQRLLARCTRDQNQNIFYESIAEGRAMPALNFPREIRVDDECGGASTCEEMFDKAVLDVECAKDRANRNACRCDERYVYLDFADCPRKCDVVPKARVRVREETPSRTVVTVPEIACDANDDYNGGASLLNGARNVQLLSLTRKHNPYACPKTSVGDAQPRALLLQNVAQPIKYLAVKNGTTIRKIPIYVKEGSVGITSRSAAIPLKVVALMDAKAGATNGSSQEVATRVIPLRTTTGGALRQLDDLAAREKSDQPFAKRLDTVNAVLIDPDLQSSGIWYPSSL